MNKKIKIEEKRKFSDKLLMRKEMHKDISEKKYEKKKLNESKNRIPNVILPDPE
ncbi:hypothetical protein SAMN05446037_101364 [Anaerovirgula multivorans]|uniref:Uncharacterized protein n=1 Tax=Anaerovirgula multivorans TaxID=312168 RepID=A0A239FKT1_9FIRM|nr:hypothetical protein [Anaerovirgula multivorans]SNS57381.1 hypothetical protein SAMN05446037_101364 [Anaerovirgula multivorans]